jgi:hypothetical protein
MKNLQKIKVTMLNGRAFNYVVTQEENNGIMKMRTARGKKEFFVNMETLTWNENGTNLTASKIEA